MTDGKGQGVGVFELFRDGRALRTLCLWLAFFCCLLMVYALSSWLPKLMASAGYSLGSSLSFLLALNFGGMAGAELKGDVEKDADFGGRLAEAFEGFARLSKKFRRLRADSVGAIAAPWRADFAEVVAADRAARPWVWETVER